MKILYDSYNCCAQNTAGGVQSKIKDTLKAISSQGVEIKLFDKWNDKIDDFDLIHFFKLSGEHFSLMKLAKSKGKKVVLSSIVALEGERRIKAGLFLGKLRIPNPISYAKKQLELCDAIITETEKEKKFIIENYNVASDKIIVIPNGISPSILGGDPNIFREKYKLFKPFVLQLGRFDRNKNQINVIRALKGTDIPLVFIGGADSCDKSYYDKCMSEASSDMIFTDWIEHSSPLLASALAAAEVLVLPSYKEIFGNAVFEGIANRTKIVATDVLPINQWDLGSMVLPIKASDINDIKNQILKSMSLECSEETILKVLSEYSFDNVANKHIALYNELLR